MDRFEGKERLAEFVLVRMNGGNPLHFFFRSPCIANFAPFYTGMKGREGRKSTQDDWKEEGR